MSICDQKPDERVRTGADLVSLYINPTRYCNLACKHCWLSPPVCDEVPKDSGELTSSEMIAIVKEAMGLGLGSIKLTGGEPLLSKEIWPLVEFCKSSGIEVQIETNGTLVTPEVAEKMKLLGVSHVSVSLDSAVPEKNDRLRGRKGAFEKAVSGMKNLIAAGIHPQVIMSLYKDNMDEFDVFMKLMGDVCTNDIKINSISPLGRASDLGASGMVPSVQEVIDFYRAIRRDYADFQGSIFMDIPAAFKSLNDIFNGGCAMCGIKGILGILSDGGVSICGIGYMDSGLLFGNARKDPKVLKDIWENTAVLEKIREDIPSKLEGVCGRCILRQRCFGSCRAEAYHNTGSLTSSFWFCQEAYNQGIFPQNRLMPHYEKTL